MKRRVIFNVLYFSVLIICAMLCRIYAEPDFLVKEEDSITSEEVLIEKGSPEHLNEAFAKSGRCIIIIGDSYGITYLNEDGTGWIGWDEAFKTLFPNADYYAEPVGGAGLVKGGFGYKKQLYGIVETYNPKDVTDILLVGGYNDADKSKEELEAALSDIVSFSSSHWPDVNISYMYVPRSYKSVKKSNLLINYEKIIRDICFENDVVFVEGAMAILDSIDDIYIDDVDSNSGFHPSTEGAEKIAISIAMYILTGDID